MSITFVSSVEQSTNNDATPLSFTTDIGTRTDGFLVALVRTLDVATHTLSSPTWNSVAMGVGPTRIRETATGFFQRVSIFFISNPTNGSNTFSAAYSDGGGNQANNSYIVLAWFDGVHQVTAEVLDDSADGEGSTDPSLDLTPTEFGELLVMIYASEADSELAAGSGETLLQGVDIGTRVAGASYAIQTTATTQTMNFTGTDDVWVAVAASFKAVDVGGDPPTVALDTADASTLDNTPTLAFTGTSDAEPIRYNIQISSSPTFDTTPVMTDSQSAGGIALHPNPGTTLAWTGQFQVDDRFCQSFTGAGGFLHQATAPIDMDAETDGQAVARVYAHQGTFGTSSAPLNPALPDDTPTPNWLAESEPIALTTASPDQEYAFDFEDEQRIYLADGEHYVLAFDWWPETGVYLNTIVFSGDTTPTHPGNAYVDGSSVNNGTRDDFDLRFEIWEQASLLDKVSGTDSGFAGSPDNSDPFDSEQQVSFTVQAGDELFYGVTYYWRVRGIDPDGTNTYGDWSETREFTVEEDGDQTVLTVGIVSGAAFGTASITTGVVTVVASAIASAEAFGTASVSTSAGSQTLLPSGIASLEAFGTATIVPGEAIVAASGIASLEAFGTATIVPGAVTVVASDIASSEAFGAATIVPGAVTIIASGIASGETFGTAVIASGVATIAATGIASTENFGTALLIPGAITVITNGISSELTFGDTVIFIGQIITTGGIASGETFGTTVLVPGAVTIIASAIASSEVFGTADLTGATIIAVSGVASGEAFGTALLAPGEVTIAANGIASGATFGTMIVAVDTLGWIISPEGVASGEAFETLLLWEIPTQRIYFVRNYPRAYTVTR